MGWERGILAAAPSGFRRQRLWLSAPDHTCVAAAVPCAQNQRAFQKQDNIFVGKKRALGSKKPGIRETRYYKSVGLGIKTPRTAIEGTYVDKKCPWTGAQCRRAPRLRTLCRQFSFTATAPCPPPADRRLWRRTRLCRLLLVSLRMRTHLIRRSGVGGGISRSHAAARCV